MKFLDIRAVNLRKDFIAKIADRGIRIHVIFCTALLFLFCILVFSSRYAISLIPRAIVSYLLLLACAYTGRWICRSWLASDKWIVLIISYIGAALLYSMIAAFSYMYFLDLGFEGSGLFVMFVTIPGFVIVFLVGGGFVAITRAARREQVHRLLVTQQQKDSELGLLMSQLNPHFLFNTLNNLYGLSIAHHEKIPALLLRLADLLRYSVYESRKDFVSLNDELAYITNYIELEKIRLAGKLSLNVQLEKVSDGVSIAPMLLITFVENAFKHAKNSVGQKIAIDVNLSVVAGCISFAVGNRHTTPSKSVSDRGGEEHLSIKTDGKIYRIRHDDLLYIEASGNYTKLYTTGGVIKPGMPFSGVEKLLPDTRFIRVHRSFIVNKTKITCIQGNIVYLNKLEIPIGKSYKADLLRILDV